MQGKAESPREAKTCGNHLRELGLPPLSRYTVFVKLDSHLSLPGGTKFFFFF